MLDREKYQIMLNIRPNVEKYIMERIEKQEDIFDAISNLVAEFKESYNDDKSYLIRIANFIDKNPDTGAYQTTIRLFYPESDNIQMRNDLYGTPNNDLTLFKKVIIDKEFDTHSDIWMIQNIGKIAFGFEVDGITHMPDTLHDREIEFYHYKE